MFALLRQASPECLSFARPFQVFLGELLGRWLPFHLLAMLKVCVVTCCVSAGPDGQEVSSQLLPVSNATRKLQATMLKTNLTESNEVAASVELAFIASVPPVGWAL